MTWGPFMRVEIAQEFAALERAEWPVGFGPWMPNRERSEDRAAQVPADVVAACEREQERQRGIARRGQSVRAARKAALVSACDAAGISIRTYRWRRRNGWTHEQAVAPPLKRGRPRRAA